MFSTALWLVNAADCPRLLRVTLVGLFMFHWIGFRPGLFVFDLIGLFVFDLIGLRQLFTFWFFFIRVAKFIGSRLVDPCYPKRTQVKKE